MNQVLRPFCLFLFLTVLAIGPSGCGVMFGGSKYYGTVIVRNNAQALIFADGVAIGKGRVTSRFPRRGPLQIKLSYDSCAPHVQTFSSRVRGGNVVLNLMAGVLLGSVVALTIDDVDGRILREPVAIPLIIDIASGAAYKPDHRRNPAVIKVNRKTFLFSLDYPGCPAE
jgi:hypothetical protein